MFYERVIKLARLGQSSTHKHLMELDTQHAETHEIIINQNENGLDKIESGTRPLRDIQICQEYTFFCTDIRGNFLYQSSSSKWAHDGSRPWTRRIRYWSRGRTAEIVSQRRNYLELIKWPCPGAGLLSGHVFFTG